MAHYIVRVFDRRMWLVGPFETEAAAAHGAAKQTTDWADGPRWQTIVLVDGDRVKRGGVVVGGLFKDGGTIVGIDVVAPDAPGPDMGPTASRLAEATS